MSTAMAGAAKDIHQEQPVRTYSGFVALAIGIALLVLAGWLVNDIFANVRARVPISFAMLATTVVVAITAVLVLLGLYTLQPNEAAIIQLFGAYRGTTRTPGLRATNPFYTRKKLSLRARNLNGERLKVNDKRGNPIEIAAVVVWRVDDTAKAFFDVDSYENYVKLQAEAAVRHLASSFAYDDADRTMPDTAEPTLLASATTVTRALVTELEERFEKAGRHRRGGADHAPRVRAGNRAGDAAPSAGRGDHRRAHEDRSWRRIDGADGAERAVGAPRRRARRRAARGDGEQLVDGAVRRIGGATRSQHRHAVRLRAAHADDAPMTGKKAFLLRLDPAVWDGLERLARAELRSVNAEIEYLLRDALAQRGIKPKSTAGTKKDD